MPFITTRLRGGAIVPYVVHPMAFPPFEARWVLRRLEFHHVPKHASWLNMVARLVCCAANAWTGASPSKGLHYSENSAAGFLKMCTTRFTQWRTEENRLPDAPSSISIAFPNSINGIACAGSRTRPSLRNRD